MSFSWLDMPVLYSVQSIKPIESAGRRKLFLLTKSETKFNLSFDQKLKLCNYNHVYSEVRA